MDSAIAHAKKIGATDAGADASEGCGLSVSVRKGELENVERNRDKSLGVTVYVGQRRGNASTSDFSKAAIERTVQAAFDIARFTAEDPFAALPDEADIATEAEIAAINLDLFHPWAVTSEQAAALALECEAAALNTSKRSSPTAKARACRPSKATFSARTRMGSGAVMPARGNRCRCRPSLAVATTCSATAGTAPRAMLPIWRLPRRLAATRRNVR